MPEFYFEHVMLKYLLSHRRSCSQRSSEHFMMLAGTKEIAARAQPPGKRGNIMKIVKSSLFETDIYLVNVFWELWSFATKNVGFEHRFFSY